MKKTALAKYIFSMLLFGMNGIVAGFIPLNSYEIVFFRTSIGSLFLLAVFLLKKGRFHLKQHPKDALLISLSGISMGLSWMFLYEGFRQIGVSVSTLLYYTGPVLVMLLSPLLFREKLRLPTVLGFGAVVAGIVLLNGTGSDETLNPFGVLCGLLSAAGYCLMVTLNKKARHIRGLENTVLQLAAAFFTVSIFLVLRQGLHMHVPLSAWPWIAVLGTVTTGYACFLYFSTLSLLPVQTAAVWGYLEALSAVVFAAVFLQESMLPLQWLGAGLIIGGAMAAQIWKKKAT